MAELKRLQKSLATSLEEADTRAKQEVNTVFQEILVLTLISYSV